MPLGPDARRAVDGLGAAFEPGRGALLDAYLRSPTVSLELVDPRFYHLDTCLCVLPGGQILVYPPALSGASYRACANSPARISSSWRGTDDALHLAVNAVALGRHVVLATPRPRCVPRLEAWATGCEVSGWIPSSARAALRSVSRCGWITPAEALGTAHAG